MKLFRMWCCCSKRKEGNTRADEYTFDMKQDSLPPCSSTCKGIRDEKAKRVGRSQAPRSATVRYIIRIYWFLLLYPFSFWLTLSLVKFSRCLIHFMMIFFSFFFFGCRESCLFIPSSLLWDLIEGHTHDWKETRTFIHSFTQECWTCHFHSFFEFLTNRREARTKQKKTELSRAAKKRTFLNTVRDGRNTLPSFVFLLWNDEKKSRGQKQKNPEGEEKRHTTNLHVISRFFLVLLRLLSCYSGFACCVVTVVLNLSFILFFFRVLCRSFLEGKKNKVGGEFHLQSLLSEDHNVYLMSTLLALLSSQTKDTKSKWHERLKSSDS